MVRLTTNAYLRSPIHNRNLVILLIIFVLFFLLSSLLSRSNLNMFNRNKIREGKKCHQINKSINGIKFFEDITETADQPDANQAIFFHDTSCTTNGLAHLHVRQACAVEAAAKLNPKRQVFVTFLSPVGFKHDKPLPPIMDALNSYDNIEFRNINLKKYAAGTPINEWIATDEIFLSDFLEEHTKTLLKYLTMYRYGGTYIDMDIILQKPLDEVVFNCAAAESRRNIDDAFLHFDIGNVGQSISENCLREFIKTFDCTFLHSIGAVLAQVLERICHVDDVALMNADRCQGFTVLLPKTFFPVEWDRWQLLFEPTEADKTMELIDGSIGIRLWNALSSEFKVKKGGSPTAYGVVAAKSCPKVFNASSEFF